MLMMSYVSYITYKGCSRHTVYQSFAACYLAQGEMRIAGCL